MVLRIVVSIVALPLLFLILYVFPAWTVPFALTVISVISVYELLIATGFIKNKLLLYASVVFSMLVVPWVYIGAPDYSANVAVFLFGCFLFVVALIDNKNVTFEQICGAFFSGIFVPIAFSSIIRILRMEHGDFLVLLPFICAWLSDSSAYFIGRFFGKHQLAPSVSPKKTIEGAIGGIAGAVIGCLIFAVVCRVFLNFAPSFTVLLLVGFFGSLVSQFGDLCLSFIKREFKIKDYGKIFPGHGGMLDRFDSVLFAAPAVEMMLTIAISFFI